MYETKPASFGRLWFFIAFLFLVPRVSAQTLPTEIEESLEAYSSLATAPISLHWSGRETNYWDVRENLNTESRPEVYSLAAKYLRQGQQFCFVGELTPRSGGQPFGNTFKFDGEVLSAVYEKDVASSYRISDLSRTQPSKRVFSLPYLEAVGVYCPTRHGEIVEGTLQSNILYLIRNGGRLVSCEEVRSEEGTMTRVEIVARNPGYDEFLEQNEGRYEEEINRKRNGLSSEAEFEDRIKSIEDSKEAMPMELRWVYYLSPENSYAVTKHDRLSLNNKLIASYSGSSFKHVPSIDIVLARDIEKKSFEKIGQYSYEVLDSPIITLNLSVTEVSFEAISKEHFVLNRDEIPAGATVVDAANSDLHRDDGSVITFSMPASPEKLDAAAAIAAGEYSELKRSNYMRFFVLALNVVVILVLISLIYIRKKKHNRGNAAS